MTEKKDWPVCPDCQFEIDPAHPYHQPQCPKKKEEWRERYAKRFLEKRKLSDGSSSEYIHLKGTALDKDFQDFVARERTLAANEMAERIAKKFQERNGAGLCDYATAIARSFIFKEGK